MKRRYSPYFIAGVSITAVIVFLVVLGKFWTPFDPNAMLGSEKLLPPSIRHIMGTDNFGRDIFSRVLGSLNTTFTIAFWTVVIGAVGGTIIGALTGYFGGVVDEVLMRFNDAMTAFPSVLLAMLFISLFGNGKYNVIAVLGIVFIPSFARVTRASFASLRDKNFVRSARLMGASNARIIFVHLLPNTLNVLLPAITIGFNNAVLAEASMSYLGICGSPPDVSLGYMLSEGQSMLSSAPWYALCVGLVIVLLIFSTGLIGEGLARGRGEPHA